MKGLTLYRRFRPYRLSYMVRHLSGTDDNNSDRHTATRGAMNSYMQQTKAKRQGQGQIAGDKPWSPASYSGNAGSFEKGESTHTRAKRQSKRHDTAESDYEYSDDSDMDSETRREIDMVANYDHEENVQGKNPDDYFALSDDDDPATLQEIRATLRDLEAEEAREKREREVMARENAELPGHFEEEISEEWASRKRRGEKPLSDKEEEEKFKRDARIMEKNAEKNAEAGMAPEEVSQLMDMEYFQAEARKGHSIDTSDMDQFDSFLADVLMEGVKTGSVKGIMEVDEEAPEFKNRRTRNRIPHPRTTRQLAKAVTPQIKSVPQHTDGYKVACEAWEVLSKNPYYTQADKIEMCNYLAREYDYIMGPEGLYDEDQLPALSTVNGGRDSKGKVYGTGWSKQMIEKELIWNDNFKPGIQLIEKEQMADKQKEQESLTKATFAQQAQTDWSVEAVVDEDDLFK